MGFRDRAERGRIITKRMDEVEAAAQQRRAERLAQEEAERLAAEEASRAIDDSPDGRRVVHTPPVETVHTPPVGTDSVVDVDSKGNPLGSEEADPAAAAGLGDTTEKTFDANGKLVTATDNLGTVWTFNADGEIVGSAAPGGTRWSFDEFGEWNEEPPLAPPEPPATKPGFWTLFRHGFGLNQSAAGQAEIDAWQKYKRWKAENESQQQGDPVFVGELRRRVGEDAAEAYGGASGIRVLGEKKPGDRPYNSVAEDFIGPMINVESKGVADAKNPKSSATGRSQFVEDTWMEMIDKYRPDLKEGRNAQEIYELRKDPAIDREMAIRYTEENAAKLDKLGYPLTKRNLYLMHFAGPSDAPKLLKAPRSDLATKHVKPDSAASNPSVFFYGKYIKNAAGKKVFKYEMPKRHKTVGQVLDWADKFA